MKPIVPFISNLPKQQIKHWIKALSKKMPKEKIVNFQEMPKLAKNPGKCQIQAPGVVSHSGSWIGMGNISDGVAGFPRCRASGGSRRVGVSPTCQWDAKEWPPASQAFPPHWPMRARCPRSLNFPESV